MSITRTVTISLDEADIAQEFCEMGAIDQRQYHDLIVESVPGCTWHIAGPREPIHARDADGTVVAVVMPVIADAFEPMPACAE